ncbi:MAG: hypothetical protein WAM30_15630 [Candidatus Dormiibacterota bacterium]
MAAHEMTAVQVGFFASAARAEAARQQLIDSGFGETALHLARPQDVKPQPYLAALGIGIGGGGVIGLIIAGVLGYFVTLAASGIGPVDDGTDGVVIVGLFAVFGLLSGATAGGLFAMAAASDPAQFLRQELESGRYLLGVEAATPEQQRRAELALDEAGADDVAFLTKSETAERVFA